MQPVKIATWSEVPDREPLGAEVDGVDLVIVRFDDNHSVLYGRCLHRGALMSDGHLDGDNLICGVHYWDYRLDTGISEYNNSETLHKFSSWVEEGEVLWTFPWPGQSNGGANCAMVVGAGNDRFLIGKGYGGGSALVDAAPAAPPDLLAGSPTRIAVKLRPEGGELTLGE